MLNTFYEENYIPVINMYAPNNIDKYRKKKISRSVRSNNKQNIIWIFNLLL